MTRPKYLGGLLSNKYLDGRKDAYNNVQQGR